MPFILKIAILLITISTVTFAVAVYKKNYWGLVAGMILIIASLAIATVDMMMLP